MTVDITQNRWSSLPLPFVRRMKAKHQCKPVCSEITEQNITFSSWCIFRCEGEKGCKQWLKETPIEKNGPVQLAAWVVIGNDFKRLVVLPVPCKDAAAYIKLCLEPNLDVLQRKRTQFVQCGTGAHRADAIRSYLEANNVNVLADGPVNWPHLDGVEVLWMQLKQTVATRPRQTATGLEEAIREAFQAIPQSEINKIVSLCSERHDVVLAPGEEAQQH